MGKVWKYFITTIVALSLTTIPAFAGEWVKGASVDYPDAWSYKDGNTWTQNDYVFEGGEGLDTVAYYISPCGTMITNNYAPNGVWVGTDGRLQYHNGYRATDVAPKAAVYGWNNGNDYITYSFYYYDDYSDGVSIAEVQAHLTGAGMENGFYLQYRLVEIGNGCYAMCDNELNTYEYYLTVSEDRSKLYVTGADGTTMTYNFLEDLIYS